MGLIMAPTTVTLAQVMAAAEGRALTLVAETAGYLALEAADQLRESPRRLGPEQILLSEEGNVQLLSGGTSVTDHAAALCLRSFLARLVHVAVGANAALIVAGERTAPVGLKTLVSELQSALIPVNRAAARRALSRLARETRRAYEDGNVPVAAPPPLTPQAKEPELQIEIHVSPEPVEVAVKTRPESKPDSDPAEVELAVTPAEPAMRRAAQRRRDPAKRSPKLTPLLGSAQSREEAKGSAAEPRTGAEDTPFDPQLDAQIVRGSDRRNPRAAVNRLSQLVENFGRYGHRSDARVCEDLKRLAGVTAEPVAPVPCSDTPPPVAAETSAGSTKTEKKRRGLSGLVLAAVGFLALGVGGYSANPGSSAPSVASRPATVLPKNVVCKAVVRVEHAPEQAIIRLRPDDPDILPRRAHGPSAQFAGLPCKRPYEIIVKSLNDGRPNALRIPVPSSALEPEPGHPGHAFTRVVVAEAGL